jgi:hypothetical protein
MLAQRRWRMQVEDLGGRRDFTYAGPQ